MSHQLSLTTIVATLLQPQRAFSALAADAPMAKSVFFGLALWLGLLPPVFAYFGMSRFGWQLGTVEAVFLPAGTIGLICTLYFAALLFGFVSTALISRWMAVTYGATDALGAHFALLTIVGAPMTVGSVMHLYPDVFLNIMVLAPCMAWSMFLLYRGMPVVLRTTPEQGMLMASSLIAYLFVAFVSLIGISTALWTFGIGPRLGV